MKKTTLKKILLISIIALLVCTIISAGCINPTTAIKKATEEITENLDSQQTTQTQGSISITEEDNGIIGQWKFPIENEVLDYGFTIQKENNELKAYYAIYIKKATDEVNAGFGGDVDLHDGDMLVHECKLNKISANLYKATITRGVVVRNNEKVADMVGTDIPLGTLSYDKSTDIVIIESNGAKTPLKRA